IRAGYDSLAAGPSELEVQSKMAQVFFEHGMSFGWCSVAYGPKGTTLIEATDLRATPGEIVRIDVVGIHRGYYSDMSRVNAYQRRLRDAHELHQGARRLRLDRHHVKIESCASRATCEARIATRRVSHRARTSRRGARRSIQRRCLRVRGDASGAWDPHPTAGR